jgi:hypothetical protein
VASINKSSMVINISRSVSESVCDSFLRCIFHDGRVYNLP